MSELNNCFYFIKKMLSSVQGNTISRLILLYREALISFSLFSVFTLVFSLSNSRFFAGIIYR